MFINHNGREENRWMEPEPKAIFNIAFVLVIRNKIEFTKVEDNDDRHLPPEVLPNGKLVHRYILHSVCT
jgi:hypothetical protein